MTFEADLDVALASIRSMLLVKNKSYGNSALDPVRVFAKSDAVEQIKVRIDDKISRLVRGREMIGEDTANDLLGYLVLLKIAERMEDERRTRAAKEADLEKTFAGIGRPRGNRITGTWTKRDDKSRKFIEVKTDSKPFKGVRGR